MEIALPTLSNTFGFIVAAPSSPTEVGVGDGGKMTVDVPVPVSVPPSAATVAVTIAAEERLSSKFCACCLLLLILDFGVGRPFSRKFFLRKSRKALTS